MGGWLKRQIAGWRETRRQRQMASLDLLRERYQIFRALLDDNFRAVAAITEIGVRLKPGVRPDPALARDVTGLIAASEAMVEKLVALDEDFAGLLAMQRNLAGQIRILLPADLPAETGGQLCLSLAGIESAAGPSLVGGKAAALARLMARGRGRVPEGFAIPLSSCRLFLEQDSLLFRLTARLRRQLRQAAPPEALAAEVEAVQRAIMAAPLSAALEEAMAEAARPFFAPGRTAGLAVRSSAVSEDNQYHSFAGQYSSVLNVTSQAQLVQAFKQVVASSFSSRNLAYRIHAGLDPCAFDLAVLCVAMVDARAAGIMLTIDPNFPEAGRMLVSAVFGLGELAVAGRTMADIYYPARQENTAAGVPVIARKEQKLVCRPQGGVVEEAVAPAAQQEMAISEDILQELVCIGLVLEREEGCPQDIEWAVDQQNRLFVLQTRPYRLGRRRTKASPAGRAGQQQILLAEGQGNSGGTATGQIRIIRRRQELAALPDLGPLILVLHQSLADAVGALSRVRGVLVDLGNPADHLSNVAREYGLPMVTGLLRATQVLKDGQWVTVEADHGLVRQATDPEIRAARDHVPAAAGGPATAGQPVDPDLARLRQLIVPLNLTDAYGPTFSILECRSIHDVVRFAHEKAVLTLFAATDETLEQGGGMVRIFESDIRFLFSIIDLGGGLLERTGHSTRVRVEDIISPPFLALWRGMSTPGLSWGPPSGAAGGMGATMSNWLTDHKSARPLGMPNYAVITRDYLNLNARMDFHFIMVDTVCGLESRANYLNFRFKGGGTTPARRRRRVACIAEILEAHDFFTDVRDDLITAKLAGVPSAIIEEKLEVVGRLLGFTRLLDSAMHTDEAVHALALAFLEGDFPPGSGEGEKDGTGERARAEGQPSAGSIRSGR